VSESIPFSTRIPIRTNIVLESIKTDSDTGVSKDKKIFSCWLQLR